MFLTCQNPSRAGIGCRLALSLSAFLELLCGSLVYLISCIIVCKAVYFVSELDGCSSCLVVSFCIVICIALHLIRLVKSLGWFDFTFAVMFFQFQPNSNLGIELSNIA